MSVAYAYYLAEVFHLDVISEAWFCVQNIIILEWEVPNHKIFLQI